MAHTREQRDKLRTPLCGARTRGTGQPCRLFAGQGTDHLGIGRCSRHGGSTQTHRTHAIGVEITRRMVALAQPIEDVTAPEVLERLLFVSAGYVAILEHEVASAGELGTKQADATVRLWNEERDRLARISEQCVRSGISERMVRIKEAEAAVMMATVKGVLDELRLTSGQRQAVGPALRKHAARLAQGDPDPAYDDQIQAALALDGPPEEWAA
jgi:hypothetical protein